MGTFLSNVISGATKGLSKKKDDSSSGSDKPASVKNVIPNLKRIGSGFKKTFGGGSGTKGPSDYGPSPDQPGWAGSYKRGGKVRKTGIAKVHKGERVLTKRQAKKFGKGRRGGSRR